MLARTIILPLEGVRRGVAKRRRTGGRLNKKPVTLSDRFFVFLEKETCLSRRKLYYCATKPVNTAARKVASLRTNEAHVAAHISAQDSAEVTASAMSAITHEADTRLH